MAVLLILAAFLYLLIFPAKVHGAFTIENIEPTEVTSADQNIKLFITASNLSSATQYFQVAITKEGSSNYFGLTQNNSGNWHPYDSSPDNLSDLLTFTPIDGTWNGEVNAKIDTNDSGFQGSGNYLVKLLKYITSSGSSSNQVPLKVNFSTLTSQPTSTMPTSPTPQLNQTITEEKKTPQISILVPSNLSAGQEFDLSFVLSNFEPGNYFAKVRIGKDPSHLTLGQTQNGEWLGDTDSYSKFPTVSGSSKIKVRLSPNAEAASYIVKLRLKRTDKDQIFDSDEKTVYFSKNPNPSNPTLTKALSKTTATSTSIKTITSSKTPAPLKSQTNILVGEVMAATTTSGSLSGIMKDYYKDKDILATLSAVSLKKEGKVRKALNLILPSRNSGQFPFEVIIGLIGASLVLGSVFYVYKKKGFKLSQDE